MQPGDERIIAHLGFAKAIAARALDPRCRGADREDLVAWGVLGLVQAGAPLEPLRTWGVQCDVSAQGRPPCREETKAHDPDHGRHRHGKPDPEHDLDGQEQKGDPRPNWLAVPEKPPGVRLEGAESREQAKEYGEDLGRKTVERAAAVHGKQAHEDRRRALPQIESRHERCRDSKSGGDQPHQGCRSMERGHNLRLARW